jgi:branched-chain amino acid transport system substrate-binding protein
VLAEPSTGLRLEAFRPEAQKLEHDFTEAVKKRAGTEPYASHRLAGAGLWLLKLVLDQAKTDELEKFRSAVMSMDLPVGSMLNGWGVKFAENGQNANERVQHYMLQWQNGQMVTVWPEEFSTLRAKWMPLPAWDQRK